MTAPVEDELSKDVTVQPTLTLRERFIAWWEGYDVEEMLRRRQARADRKKSGKNQEQNVDPANRSKSGKPLWTATRIEVVEKIWGEGFATPGGDELIPTLIKPFGLNPAMSVLDLAAGLGGSTRCMATQTGAWVTGLEANPVLAEAGMFRSQKAGMARQAPVQRFDSEKFTWSKRVDAIFAKEGFFTVHNKDGLIDAIEQCLKPRGQILFTDYVVDKEKANSKIYQSWVEHEPVTPSPWTVEQYVHALQQRNLDIRISEDISDTHKHLVLGAIQSLTQHLEQHTLDNETKMWVVAEVELWARRVAVLDAGLRCYRFFALKPGDLS